jgi:predicted nuclease of restriction endonuclease-like (RecB) superfamily
MAKINSQSLFKNIKILVENSRAQIIQSINTGIAETYYNIGKLIVEYEQQGKSRAEYAGKTLKGLSAKLAKALGRGFSVDNLENMRKFYLLYSKSETVSRKSSYTLSSSSKSETVSRKFLNSAFKLSWSHYVFLIRIDNLKERKFYEIESLNERWSLRELKRQYSSALYERLSLSRNKKKIKELSIKGHIIEAASDAIKDPYILEFLALQEQDSYTESEFESAIISKLEDFIKELGKGFLFVGRQYRVTVDEEHYHIDLVFYQRILRCFVLFDLKIGDLEHKDIGQMQMYIGYFDDNIKEVSENKTIGVILCKNKKESLVKYTLPKGYNQIFTSKYKTYLPDKKELQQLMEAEPEYKRTLHE